MPERCWFGLRVNIFSHIFSTLRLRGRLGRDGCQCALWDCFGGKITAMLKMRPPKYSHNALWQPSRPVSRATSKWRIRSLQLTRLGDSLSRDHCIVPTLFEKKNWRHTDRLSPTSFTFMTLFLCSKCLGLVRIFPFDTLWLEIVTNISLQIIKKKCTFVVSFKTSPWK